jgi:hypothetical protein
LIWLPASVTRRGEFFVPFTGSITFGATASRMISGDLIVVLIRDALSILSIVYLVFL